MKSVTSPHQPDKKSICHFSPLVSVDPLEYFSCKPCLILHLRSPLINKLSLLKQIFFFFSQEISVAPFNTSHLQGNAEQQAWAKQLTPL